jgi:hypothetical protein
MCVPHGCQRQKQGQRQGAGNHKFAGTTDIAQVSEPVSIMSFHGFLVSVNALSATSGILSE